MRAYKTKAALPGRLSHFTNVTEENNTAISLVNLSRSAGAGNYGKSPQRLTVLQICNSLIAGGVRHWRSTQSPNFLGDLQSAENSANTWLVEKPANQLLAVYEGFVFLLEGGFDNTDTPIKSFFGGVGFSWDSWEATTCYVVFIIESANANCGGACINKFYVVAFKCHFYFVKGIFFGDSHSKSPIKIFALSPVLSVHGHLNAEMNNCYHLSSGQIRSKILSLFMTNRITATTAMMNVHLLSILAPLFLVFVNQFPGLINLAQALCSRNKSPLLLPQVAGLLWEKKTQRHSETTATTINATTIFLRIGNQPCGSSLAFLRWRFLISPWAAVTRNPAVLSPSSFKRSISSITSWGTRTVVICDFAFFTPVAITGSPYVRCISVYAKKMIIKGLKCISLEYSFKKEGEIHLVVAKPDSVSPQTGPLTTNDRISIEAAMKNHTTHPQGRNSLTPNKFTWRFMALSVTESSIVCITAATEREAREQAPVGCVMVFAGRLPAREVRHA